MSGIDWERITGRRDAMSDMPDPEFTDDDIQMALAKVAALPAVDPSDPDEVATFWPVVTKFGLSDLDFRRVQVSDVPLAGLSASNPDLSREKLEEHVENCCVSESDSPLDLHPIVLQSKKKLVIVDGQHRLAAAMLLGATTWPCFVVPK